MDQQEFAVGKGKKVEVHSSTWPIFMSTRVSILKYYGIPPRGLEQAVEGVIMGADN